MHEDVCSCTQFLRGQFDKMHAKTHLPTAKMHGARSTGGDPVDAAGFMEPLEALTGHSTGEDGRATFASCTRREAWSRRLNPFMRRIEWIYTHKHTYIDMHYMHTYGYMYTNMHIHLDDETGAEVFKTVYMYQCDGGIHVCAGDQ